MIETSHGDFVSPRITAIAVLLVLAPALAAQDTLRVRQILPAGELRPASVITVTFNRPLAGTLERLRDPATVVRLVPMIAARFEWRDPATIRVIPVAPLPPGSSLSITIDTLTSADGARLTTSWSHAFTVRSPAVVRTFPPLGVNQRPMLDPSGRILLRLSGEIDTLEFARTARLVASSPSGCRALDTASIDAYLSPEALESDRRRTGEAEGDGTRAPLWPGWTWNPWEQVERYDDRVVFHARTLSAGSHLFSYVARATTPGRFVRPQAHAVEMYNPALGGRSDGGWFVVRAR